LVWSATKTGSESYYQGRINKERRSVTIEADKDKEIKDLKFILEFLDKLVFCAFMKV
jgi:hypothetical protein